MSVTFLIGSGASVPAEFPSVTEITTQVASACKSSHLPAEPRDATCKGGEKLLRWLQVQIKRRYGDDASRLVHYENVYFLAKQLLDDLDDEYDNPAIRPFVESAVDHVLSQSPTLTGDAHQELRSLADWLTRHIRKVVVKQIGTRKGTRCDHLDFILEGIEKSGISNPTVLSLNHDTLIEAVFRRKNIPFADGFASEANIVGVRQWQAGQLVKAGRVRLLKLHGGIDWLQFRPHGMQSHLEDYCGIPTNHSSAKRDTLGRVHYPLDDLPIFLIGAWDKLARYTDPIYLELYYTAFEALAAAKVLVVVGYGFGDKGINKLVADWMCRSLEHRLVVVDRNANELWQHARGAIALKWQPWLEERRLIPLRVDLNESKISWSLIEDKLKM